jgi:replicative DNA helicase
MNTEILDQLPPCDVTAERAVLGCLLLDGRRIDDVLPILRAEDFYADANAKIYKHIVEAHNACEVFADIILFVGRLTKAGDLEVIGGPAYLAEIMHSVGATSYAPRYAERVAEKAQYRRLRTAGEELIRSAQGQSGPASAIAAKAADALTEIGAGGHQTDVVDAAEVVRGILIEIDKPERRLGLPTGFPVYDEPLGGLYDGEMIVLAARPRMGKSALAANIATNVARVGRDVLFVSVEMPAEQLARRMLSSESGVDSNDIRTGRLTDEDKSALADAANSLPLDHLHLTDRPGTTVADIRWTARRLQRQGTLALIVVDYLQRLTPADPRAQRYEQVGQMSGDLKKLTLELGIPVLVLAQLNRQSEAKGDHRPRLGQLRESGDIEQDADVVALLHREEQYSKNIDDRGKAELIIAKNRSGPEAEIAMKWDGATTTFRDPDYEWTT